MNTQDILSIVSIAISTILSVGAIILSIWFYYTGNKQNKDTALMQSDIRSAIDKLEKIHDRSYTDTFGAFRTQIDTMQKHIFSSVGNTNTSQSSQLKYDILRYLSQNSRLEIQNLCQRFKTEESIITEVVYELHKDKFVEFNGTSIKYIRQELPNTAGQSSDS